ncbi:MAG: hypothetical protein CUN56_04690 [Phototrophicales bacterium]|nr:MAG: hypothetical protein CUN56_04690 [Phototrophicales bacterium]RMG78006.1 MAG: hypothetical protein D6711_00155 [Chloroflexota bacterium]
MSSREADTRTINLVDIPLIRRVSDHASMLNCELACTDNVHGPSGAILTNILLPQRGLYTLVTRSSKPQVVGQFRLRGDDQNAHIVYLAPTPHPDDDDTAWLFMLDAMTREAGKLHAHALIGEVEEGSALFEIMRTSGFAVYARQQLWYRMPGDYPCLEPPVYLRPAISTDYGQIQALIAQTVPGLLQQVIAPSGELNGWVYDKHGQIEAYLDVTIGRYGIYIVPYINPDILSETPAIIHHLTQSLQKSGKLPVTICIRRYQEWIKPALEALQFKPGARQALMVRRIAAVIRQPRFQLTKSILVPALSD